MIRDITRARRGGRQVGWRIWFTAYAPATWKADKWVTIVRQGQ